MASKHAYEEYSVDTEREMDAPRAARVGFAERVTTVADDTDGSRDGTPDDTAVDAELADDGPDDFDMNPFTLMFKDSDAEAGYVRFITGQAYFAAGKLYTFIAGFFMVFLIIPFLRWRPAWSDFNDAFVLVMVGGAVTAFASFGLLFVSAAPRWREVLFTFVVATHWGSLGTTSVRKKEDEVYRYGITTVCLFYCCFLAQPRFILVFIFLVVLSTIAIAAVTFGSEEYFKHHTYFEVLYWPILLAMFPIHILRKFEMRSRAAYQASEMTRAFLRGLARRSKAMYRIIARSYPVSAAMRVLDSRGSTNYALYPNTALVVTDVQGFTAWASVTSSDAVVKGISKMFIAMEQEALKFAVEKISTVGDSFVGAVFPPRNSHTALAGNGSGTVSPRQPRSPTTSPRLPPAAKASPSADHEMKRFPSAGDSVGGGGGDGGFSHEQQSQEDVYDTATRCHRALRFAHAVRHHPHVMTIRIGVHIGAVVGGFVGLQPPKFDVFGQGIKIAQELEHNGQPNRIHASRQILDAAALVGFPSDDHTTTPLGVLFSAWRLRDPRAHTAEAARLAEGTVAVEKNAMLLCALVARSSEALYARTMRSGDTRDAATRQRLRTLAAGATRAVENGPGLDMSSAQPSLMGSASSVALNEHTNYNNTMSTDETAAAAIDAGDTTTPDAASGNVVDNAAGVEKLFVFSIFTLTFADDEAEQAYRAWYLETGLATVIFSSLTCMFTYLLVAHVCTACTGTALDKLAIIIAAAILLAYLTFLREKGTAHGHNPKIGAAVYLAVFYTLALLYQPGGCSAADAGAVDPKAPGNSIMVMGVIPAAAMMLCLELSLIARAVAHSLMCGQLVLVVFVRHLIYGSDEGVLQYDVFPFVVFASLILMSYFTDFNLRLAFQDESRQSALEALERSSADLCNAALEMLLPNFVVERLVRESAFDTATTADGNGVDGTTDENRSLLAPRRRGSAAQRSDAGHDDDDERRSQSVRSTGRPESSVGRASSRHSRRSRMSKSRSVGTTTLFGGSATNSLWPFQRAVVLFVSFEPPTLRYNAVRDTVARIEVAARARGLQKVKTIGTMVLLVAGADDDDDTPADEMNDPWQPSQRVAETAINVAEAAIEIKRHAFVNTGLEAAGWKVQIGIHAGPLFGAVIGSQGLAFDIYGDTVNTASRMCTTAKASASGAGNDSIQCSESFFADIPYEATAGFVGFAAERRPDPVAVKGKGMMTVYRLFERTAATSVTPTGSTPAVSMSPADNHSTPASPIMLLGTPQARSTSPHQSLRSPPRSPLAAAAAGGSGRTADDGDDIDDVEALTSSAVPVEPDASVPGAVAQE